jgi:hypothetical protein
VKRIPLWGGFGSVKKIRHWEASGSVRATSRSKIPLWEACGGETGRRGAKMPLWVGFGRLDGPLRDLRGGLAGGRGACIHWSAENESHEPNAPSWYGMYSRTQVFSAEVA